MVANSLARIHTLVPTVGQQLAHCVAAGLGDGRTLTLHLDTYVEKRCKLRVGQIILEAANLRNMIW